MPVDVSPMVATRRVPTESDSAVELRVRLRKSAAKRLAALNAGRPKKAARADGQRHPRLDLRSVQAGRPRCAQRVGAIPVSYTHLTLPTILLV